MSARLERIARMKPDDRYEAVVSFIEGLIVGSSLSQPTLKVTYRPRRTGDRKTEQMKVVGVAWNDNGTSFGELIVQAHSHSVHRLYGISLSNIDALEFSL